MLFPFVYRRCIISGIIPLEKGETFYLLLLPG